MTDINLVPLAYNLSRVYEIAKNGNFKVKLIGGKKYDNSVVYPEDVEMLRNFYGFEFPEKEPDIFAEVAFDSGAILNCLNDKGAETLDQINARIAAYDFSDLVVNRELSSACTSLLKVGIDRLDLTATTVFKIIDIAAVIAKMGDSKILKPEHVAEALQYHSLPKEHRV